MLDKIEDVKKEYLKQLKLFDNMETHSSPSGEWDEYNINYLAQQAIVNTFEEVLIMLGEQDFVDKQYEEE